MFKRGCAGIYMCRSVDVPDYIHSLGGNYGYVLIAVQRARA